MEYLPLIVILGAMSACAIAAYELFDWIERDEYERPSAASLGPMMQDVRPGLDQFDTRIRGLEARLSRLEHECDRIATTGPSHPKARGSRFGLSSLGTRSLATGDVRLSGGEAHDLAHADRPVVRPGGVSSESGRGPLHAYQNAFT